MRRSAYLPGLVVLAVLTWGQRAQADTDELIEGLLQASNGKFVASTIFLVLGTGLLVTDMAIYADARREFELRREARERDEDEDSECWTCNSDWDMPDWILPSPLTCIGSAHLVAGIALLVVGIVGRQRMKHLKSKAAHLVPEVSMGFSPSGASLGLSWRF